MGLNTGCQYRYSGASASKAKLEFQLVRDGWSPKIASSGWLVLSSWTLHIFSSPEGYAIHSLTHEDYGTSIESNSGESIRADSAETDRIDQVLYISHVLDV